MDIVSSLLLVCLGFAIGFLACLTLDADVKLTGSRRDWRTIDGLRGELARHIELYKAEKKRREKLTHSLRCANRIIRGEPPKFGRSMFRDPTLLAAHKMRQHLTEHFMLGAVPGMKCFKCEQPGLVRLGDTHYCKAHAYGQTPDDVETTEGGGKVSR